MLLSATSVFAQDVIVKKDGSTILSKVIEIGTSEVKYKKFSNQNGPTYSISKSEIQAINYENGEKEDFTVTAIQQSQQDYNVNYSSQMAAGIAAGNRLQREKLLASAKSWKTVGDVWAYANIFGGLGLYIFTDLDWPVWAGLSASGVIGGLVCNAIGNNKENAAYSIKIASIITNDFTIGNTRFTAKVDLINDKLHKDRAIGLGLCVNL